MSEPKTQGVLALLDQYKDEKSLKAFAEAQMKTITSLSKELTELKKANDHLKNLLETSTPLIKGENDNTGSSVRLEGLMTQDDEAIAVLELNRLRDIAMERSLTLEESRKAELFHKMLITLKNQPKTIVVESKKLSTDELLALATSESSSNSQESK